MASYSAQPLINHALTNLGILEQGGTPSVTDSLESLTRLNYLIGQWRLQNKFIWSITIQNFPLTANVGSYTIGPTGTFNVLRPNYIERAYIQFAGPGANQITSPLDIINASQFGDIADLSATAELPELLYPDYASPLSTLYLYPKPRVTVASNLQLFTWAQLGAFATLVATADLPDGYPEAITNALAVRLMPMFGVAVASQVRDLTSQLALQAEQSIADLNARARGLMVMPPPPAATPNTTGGAGNG